MSWLSILVISTAGLASMKAAVERGDLDEASRQGVLAGPAVVESALAAPDRPTQLAGIAAAPAVEDRAELLPALAQLAASADRRAAIPAARTALILARELAAQDPADDLAEADVVGMRDAFAALAQDPTRWIEVRVAALETAAVLGAAPRLLADPDPALRIAAITALPVPVPVAQRTVLATLVREDPVPRVAFIAGATLCADLALDPAAPVLDALGAEGIAMLRTLSKRKDPLGRDVQRCLRAAR